MIKENPDLEALIKRLLKDTKITVERHKSAGATGVYFILAIHQKVKCSEEEYLTYGVREKHAEPEETGYLREDLLASDSEQRCFIASGSYVFEKRFLSLENAINYIKEYLKVKT